MPSSSIDNCARVSDTTPSVACGQTNFPLSRRLQNKHRPSPSNQISFTRSPLRPRKMNTWPDIGLFSNLVCTRALSPLNPRRRSVTPAAIQIWVLPGGAIIAADTPTTHATTLDWRRFPPALAHAQVGCESYPPSRRASHRVPHIKPAADWSSPQLLAPATVWPRSAVSVAPPDTAGTSSRPDWC